MGGVRDLGLMKNVLFYDCGGQYTTSCICENPQDWTPHYCI